MIPVAVTREANITETSVAASTLGTTSAWIGLIPNTRNASNSSRIVRAPRSAHMAVAPAPAITNTVTTGPISTRRMLSVNVVNTVNGIASRIVGNSDTRATNQV